MLSSDLLGAGSSIRSAGNARSTAGSSGTGVSRSLAAAPSAHSAEIAASRRGTAVFFWVDDDGTSVEGETSTRSISMSVLVYNANYNLYALCAFFLELSPAGVMAPTFTMKTVKMDMFVNEEDLVFTVFEAILYLYFLYFVWVEGSELYEIFRQAALAGGGEAATRARREELRHERWSIVTTGKAE